MNPSPRVRLATIDNAWLKPWEITRARHYARVGTDEECTTVLRELEKTIQHGIDMWRNSQ